MGFDGEFFARIHYTDRNKRSRRLSESMEMIWKANDDAEKNEDGSIFAGTLWKHYYPPDGLCFDSRCGDDPVMDDPRLEEYNLVKKATTLMNWIRDQLDSYQTRHLMLTIGGDFMFSNARRWYKNYDKLIKFVNEKSG